MAELAPIGFALGLLFAIMAAVAVIVRWQMRRMERASSSWSVARDELGLDDTTLDGTDGLFSYAERGFGGELNGVKVDIRVVHAPSNSTKWATLATAQAGFILPFRLRRRKLWTGAGDVATGDAEFDSAFCVEAEDPISAANLLTPSVRGAFLQLIAVMPGLEVEFNGQELSFKDNKDWPDGTQARSAVERMVAVIHALRGVGAADVALDSQVDRGAATGIVLPAFEPDAVEESPAEAPTEASVVAQTLK